MPNPFFDGTFRVQLAFDTHCLLSELEPGNYFGSAGTIWQLRYKTEDGNGMCINVKWYHQDPEDTPFPLDYEVHLYHLLNDESEEGTGTQEEVSGGITFGGNYERLPTEDGEVFACNGFFLVRYLEDTSFQCVVRARNAEHARHLAADTYGLNSQETDWDARYLQLNAPVEMILSNF